MGADIFESTVNVAKLIFIFLLMVQLVPILVWVERRGSAFIQHRFGPNRVGPLGLTQLLADAVKFLFKEEFVPGRGKPFIFYAAPIFALIPGVLAFAAIPLSMPVNIETFEMFGQTWGPYNFMFQGYDFGIGIVFVLGVSSLGAYALLMAGWGSENKYSLLGALRASAQMISYELSLGLSLVGILIIYQTFSFHEMIAMQENYFQVGPISLPAWGIFYQPLGAIIFFAATFAETNRLPFDLPEAEGELVAGFHTEYGGLKMLMFYIGEYGHMMVASALVVTMYFGGYNLPGITSDEMVMLFKNNGFSFNGSQLMAMLTLHLVFMAKILFFLWVFVWVRWTLPRFRYDQLMDLGWKTMLPWALANTIVTAVIYVVVRA